MPNVLTWKLNLANDPVSLCPVEHVPAASDLNAASRLIPGGVYTTFRTYGGMRILPIDDHIRRLEESSALVNGAVLLDRSVLLGALGEGLQVFYSRYPGFQDARVRITLDLERDTGTLYLSLEPLTTPAEQDFRQGVRAVTAHLHRDKPKAKWTGFINVAEPVRRQLPTGVNECLMVDEQGKILEGLSSNFFAVKDGELWTAETSVLDGITRTMTLDAAHRAGIAIHLRPIHIDDIQSLDEAFITSASRSVLPVVRIDDAQIESGDPGPVTRRLMDLYWEFVRSRLMSLPISSWQ